MPDPIVLLELAAILALTGVVAGVLAGLLGVGGGIVIVPVLFQMFALIDVPDAIRMHLSVGTSLTTIVATSAISTRAHNRRGAVDWALLRAWWVWILLGTVAGTAVAGYVRSAVLIGVFAVVALLVALFMATTRPDFRLREGLPRGVGRAVSGAVMGGLSAMMGIGGGTLGVPFMAACGYPVHRAVGTAAAIGFIIAVPATLGFMLAGWGDEALPELSVGFVSILGVVLITPLSTVAAPWGVRLAHAASPLTLRRLFAVFLLLTSARMFWSLL
ncbi:MAG: sulfite exporter TauE/SafE family protein [Alphaproteobacteria bacterium]